MLNPSRNSNCTLAGSSESTPRETTTSCLGQPGRTSGDPRQILLQHELFKRAGVGLFLIEHSSHVTSKYSGKAFEVGRDHVQMGSRHDFDFELRRQVGPNCSRITGKVRVARALHELYLASVKPGLIMR